MDGQFILWVSNLASSAKLLGRKECDVQRYSRPIYNDFGMVPGSRKTKRVLKIAAFCYVYW
jgi:hypothetical protein